MKRVLGITLFCVVTAHLFSQQTGNPFDLSFRKAVPAKVMPAAPVDTAMAPGNDMLPEQHVKKEEPQIQETLPGSDTGRSMTVTPVPGNPFEISPTQLPFGLPPKEDEKEKTDAPTSQHLNVSTPQPAPSLNVSTPQPRASKGFQIFFVLLSLLFLIFIVNVERSFIRDLWRVIANENYSSLHLRNQRNTMRQILLLMGYVVFFIQAGLFLYQALRFFGWTGEIMDNIWACMALVIGTYIVRHAGILYIRWLFNNDKEMTLFGFDISIFNIMVGLILLPVNILILFGPDSIYNVLIFIGVGAILAAYLLRQLRWSFNASHLITRSLFLFFIYLCAVEILPLWAISQLFW